MSVSQAAGLLAGARRVVVVAGHGLAASRAEAALGLLGHALVRRGTKVAYVVHPLAGRMPGHADLMLDRAAVPRAQRLRPGTIAAALDVADVALLVGADDVVNPAAEFPVPDVARAARIVALRRPQARSFSRLVNPVLDHPLTMLVPGDAAETLPALLAAVLGQPPAQPGP